MFAIWAAQLRGKSIQPPESNGHAALLAAHDADDRAVAGELASENPRLPVRQVEAQCATLEADVAQGLPNRTESCADELTHEHVIRSLDELELDVEIERDDARPADPAARERVRKLRGHGAELLEC